MAIAPPFSCAAEGQPALDVGADELAPVQHEIEASPQIAVGDVQGHQAAAPKGILQGDARQTADAETGLHRPLDRFGVLQLQQNLELRQQSAEGAVKGLARAGAGLAEDPGRRQQIVVVESVALGQHMVGCTEGDEFILPPGGDVELGMAVLPFDQTQIEVKSRHPGGDLLGIGDLERYPGAGPFVHVAGDQAHRQIVADGQGRADLECRGIGAAGKAGLQRLRLFQQRQRLGAQSAAQFVEAQPLAGAVEELHIELALQVAQGAACRGL